MTAAALTVDPPRSQSLATRTLARIQAFSRTGFHTATAAALWRLGLPVTEIERQYARHASRDAYDLHVRILERPGMREVLRKVEREDLATLPFFVAATPFDILRVVNKRRRGVSRKPVHAPDSFPYPDYYLNDFHNQANGNLSLQAALTYEWQIRFLFLGTNRLMRQGVVDQIPEGDGLDILDVACGTASWLSQARLQNRHHRYTGIDLSPHYLKVAKLFRGRGATFLQMNAEELAPAWSNRFDVVTCIWLFHELPASAIERTTAEFARVLKPGGKLVFMDAAQRQDSPQAPGAHVEGTHKHFFDLFNEPYFLAYQKLDLPDLLARHGLTVRARERWHASVLLTATKD